MTRRNSSYVVIANYLGPTPAGTHYYEKSGLTKPDATGLDRNQTLIHKGGSDYIQAASGKQRLIRTLQPNGKTILSALGKQWFRNSFSEYVVHVPVKILGLRSNGRAYSRDSTLPVDQLGLGQIMSSQGLTAAERIKEVKKKVLAGLTDGGISVGGRQTLMEISGETFQLDREGAWLISELTTTVDDQGAVSTEARINQRLGVLRDAASFLPYHEQILEQAFEKHDDMLCVPRQIAILLGKSLASISASFDDLLGSPQWRSEGISAVEMKKWCCLRGHPFMFVSSGKLLLLHEPPVKRGRALAGVAFDGHFYFYKSARCLAGWHLANAISKDQVLLERESRGGMPTIDSWKWWEGVVQPGHFWTRDLTFTRRQLLEGGVSPKVTLRGQTEIGSLSVPVGRQSCVIREVVADQDRIENWLSRLPREIPWCGERLPSLTQKVFFELLRAERRTPGAAQRGQILAEQDGRCIDCGGSSMDCMLWNGITSFL